MATRRPLVLVNGAVSELPLGDGLPSSGTSKTFAVFSAIDGAPPASSFATFDTRNGILVLEFDPALVESTVFAGVIPEGTDLSGGILVLLNWIADTATSGNVRWRIAFEAAGTDLDVYSFDVATEATGAANATNGIETITQILATSIDSLTVGSRYRLMVARVGNDATNDTMSGDAQLLSVELRRGA